MLHTIVATPLVRPKASASIAHAPVIPEGDRTCACPFITRHFYVVAKQRFSTRREESIRCTRVGAQIKATISFIVSISRS